MKKLLLLLVVISVAGGIVLLYTNICLSTGEGDGYLLKRSQEEICHACHKTNQNTPSPGETGYVKANWDNAIKTHSSELLGSCSNPTYKTKKACIANSGTWTPRKWAPNGWGITGGKYGEIVCTTCHTAHDTRNIYLTKETITTPDGSTFQGRESNSVSVDFRVKSGTAGVTVGTMGDDSTTHTTSNKVCQVCHTYDNTKANGVNKHAYNMGITTTHFNAQDCTRCHSHKNGFGHGGPCIECHGHDYGYEYEPGKYSQGNGTCQSHSTHTENDSDDLKGPNMQPDIVGCGRCHNTNNFPFFRSKADPNATLTLSQTDICDDCHSIGGAYDGVGVPYDDDNPNFAVEFPNSVAYGAKYHWKYKEGETWFQGVYSDIPVKYWKAFTHYSLGDFVRYELDVYRANKTFTSGATRKGSNWDIVAPWKPNTPYQVDDYVRHGVNVYKCPSAFTSGDAFNESNWELICRWLEPLRTGKENWCLGCHDDAPASSVQDGTGVLAPNVAGDNVKYGYNVTGHGIYGNPSITCLGCHDASIAHIDGNARTYSSASNNYQIGYRLAEGMAIPRNGQHGPNAFKLCFTCHDSTPFLTETNSETDFRDDNKPDSLNGVRPWNFHWEHSKQDYSNKLAWDSDYNWPVGDACSDYYICCDSAMSCTACHNVHGSPCIVGTSIVQCTDPVRNPMIRHGELISTPGTSDRVPAFQFHWYDNDGPVTDFNSSKTGGLRVGEPFNINYNHVCWGCHGRAELQYSRAPRVNIINESFERSPGYDETELWTETIGTNCTGCIINEDFGISTLIGTPPPNAGSQCLQSISASPGYEAYATRDYGSEKSSTFTSFYLYVGVDGLPNDGSNKYKKIGALINNAGKDVFALRLNKTAANQLRFNLRLLYNNGSSYYDDYAVINTGNWYRIDIKYDSINPGSANAREWWVNGTSKGSGNLTTDLSLLPYYSGIQRWEFGFSNSSQQRTGTIYYDLIKVNTISYE